MNGRAIAIGTCVLGSLVGLGFLANYVYGGEKSGSDSVTEKEPVNQNRHNNYNRTKRKSPVKKPRSKSNVKQQPKNEMAERQVTIAPVADEFPLRIGSKGERVERLQVWLMRNYGWTGKITGEFDEKTAELLKRFLKKTELDEATYYKMKMQKPVYEQIIMR